MHVMSSIQLQLSRQLSQVGEQQQHLRSLSRSGVGSRTTEQHANGPHHDPYRYEDRPVLYSKLPTLTLIRSDAKTNADPRGKTDAVVVRASSFVLPGCDRSVRSQHVGVSYQFPASSRGSVRAPSYDTGGWVRCTARGSSLANTSIIFLS